MAKSWAEKTGRAIVYGAVGAAVGFAAGAVFMVFWTALFSSVPVEYLLRYVEGNQAERLTAIAFVAVAVLVGLGIGVAKGLRPRPAEDGREAP